MEMVMQQRPERPAPLKIQFGQGHYAFTRGWMNNQYDPESVAGKEWLRGFNQAYWENHDKLKAVK
jgi:hypothetical protein